MKKLRLTMFVLIMFTVILPFFPYTGSVKQTFLDSIKEQGESIDTIYICQEDNDFSPHYLISADTLDIQSGFSFFSDAYEYQRKSFRTKYRYGLTVTLPKPDFKSSDSLSNWLINKIGSNEDFFEDMNEENFSLMRNAEYKGDKHDGKKLADYMAHHFFSIMDSNEYEVIAMSNGISYRIFEVTENYVTFFKETESYWGGAHGMYKENYITYDLNLCRELTNDDIFQKSKLDSVKKLLLEVAVKDKKFIETHGPKTMDDMRLIFFEDKTLHEYELRNCALTDLGVVFSFQPYEIGAFCDGCYHFTIPYIMLIPYMTSLAKDYICHTFYSE